MANTKIPDPLKRRHLLEEKLSPAKALALAEAYLEEKRLVEAIAFLEQAGATEKLEELRNGAVAGGDPFVLRQACEALDEEPSADEWRRTGEAARAAGRELQAVDAERQASLRD
jgi:hypothetical protein